jgi:hypothetical protein
MSQSLLVYDDRPAWLRAAVEALTRCSDDLKPAAWHSSEIQAFLDAQFDARPFALVLIEEDVVHVGSATVERVLRSRGVASSLTRALSRAYPAVAGPFGRVFHGREPAELHGTFPLDEAARVHVDPLRRGRTIPVESESESGSPSDDTR